MVVKYSHDEDKLFETTHYEWDECVKVFILLIYCEYLQKTLEP